MSLTPSSRKKTDGPPFGKGEKPAKKHAADFIEDIIEEEAPAEFGAESHDEAEPTSSHGGADDALGLYLKQMGSIPLLSRDKELALAKGLETTRRRYRRSVLFCWWSVSRITEVFRQIRHGELAIDPQIEVVQSLGLRIFFDDFFFIGHTNRTGSE
jgi:RNA polymerase primary sigma factor